MTVSRSRSPLPRCAGVLLHPTSLPGRFGVGDLGSAVDAFLDWMVDAGLSVWQVLPLHPPAVENCPYGARSCFAGDPAILSLDDLVELGLLRHEELRGYDAGEPDRIAHGEDWTFKEPLLREAWSRTGRSDFDGLRTELARYREAEASWLDDWTLYRALDQVHPEAGWTRWEESLRRRDPGALAEARRVHSAEVGFQAFLQFLFDRQWRRVRELARERGIRILGDVPIYVDHRSAEVWARPDLFDLDDAGRPRAVAGVPPDYFSETGQRWGNPLYRWDRMAESGFRWWIDRLRGDLRLADLVRVDHFRGFAGYWSIPVDEETAVAGRWETGPGRALFDAVREELGELPIVAEDLGEITPDVEELRDALELPGMVVLHFGFSSPDSPHAPHHHRHRSVVYTGTHDNDTTVGWYAGLGEEERATVDRYLGRRDGKAGPIHEDLIRAAWTSVADLSIAPVQDVLGLGSEARTNVPGRPEGNWRWRLREGALNAGNAAWLRELGRLADRRPPSRRASG